MSYQYETIEKEIIYLTKYFKEQPDLEAIGICFLAFCPVRDQGLSELKEKFPNTLFSEDLNKAHVLLKNQFIRENKSDNPIILHLKGTLFQLKVWEALLNIESSQVPTYLQLGNDIGQDKAARSVGSAIGSNPVAFLILCTGSKEQLVF